MNAPQSPATSRAPGVRARNSSGASRPASVKAFFTAATLGPKMPLRFSLAHWFELRIVYALQFLPPHLHDVQLER